MRRRSFLLGVAIFAVGGLALATAEEGMTTSREAGLYPTPIPNPPAHGRLPARDLAPHIANEKDKRSVVVDVGGGVVEQWWLDADPATAEGQAATELAKHPGARVIQRLPSPHEMEKVFLAP